MPNTAKHREIKTLGSFSWRFMTPLYMGSALNPVNSSLIATALVPIARGLHVSVGSTAVLVSALYLASAIAQPTGGKLAEEFGPRRVFLAGIALVLIGGVIGALGQNLATLIVARVLIGVGTSGGYPSAMMLIARRASNVGLTAPPGRVLGGLTIAASVTAAAGLPSGGVLVGAFGWRAVFWVNVPLALLALAMAIAWIPADRPVETSKSVREIARRIDLTGVIGFGGALAALLVFLMSTPNPKWIALGIGVLLFASLAWWEMRAADPFIDVRLLATNGALTRTYLRIALTMLCSYTVLFGLSQWLQAGRGVSAEAAGLLLLPMTVVSAVFAWPISARLLVRGPLIGAAMTALAGSIGVLLLATSTPLVWIVVITLLFGLTLGAGISANQTSLYSQVTADQLGTASGLFRTSSYLGSIASSALISVAFNSSVSDGHLHMIAVAMIIASVTGLLIVLRDAGLTTRTAVRRHADEQLR